jgi:hypothetical protein
VSKQFIQKDPRKGQGLVRRSLFLGIIIRSDFLLFVGSSVFLISEVIGGWTKKYTSAARFAPKESLAGKFAVVTGANTGIGFHTALELARYGSHDVIATSRSKIWGDAALEQMEQERSRTSRISATGLVVVPFCEKFCLRIVQPRASIPHAGFECGGHEIAWVDLCWSRDDLWFRNNTGRLRAAYWS